MVALALKIVLNPVKTSNPMPIEIKRDKPNWLLTASQVVPRPIDEVFEFFSNPANLEKLTPAFLQFRIQNVSTPTVQEGTEISYRLKVHGIPLTWLSLIEEWSPPNHFVDNQLKGPYRLWHHTHRFESIPEGTNVIDEVIYRVPGGAIVNRLFVEKDVRSIFDFRQQQLREFFSGR